MQKLPFILGDSLGAGPAPTTCMNEVQDMQGGSVCHQNNPCRGPCKAVLQRLSCRGSDQNTVTPGRSTFCLSPAALHQGWQASVLQLAAVVASQACQKEQQSPQTCCVSLHCSACRLCVARRGGRILISTSAPVWEHSW